MSFTVQPGQTIRDVTRNLGCSFEKLKSANPEAVGRTSDGRYFFKSGAVLQTPTAETVQPTKVQSATPWSSTTLSAQTGETVAEVSRRLGVPYNALLQANIQNIAQGDDGRYIFRSGSQVALPSDFKSVLAEKTSEPKAEPKAAPIVQSQTKAPVPAETPDEENNEPSLLSKVLNSFSLADPSAELLTQSNIKSPDQPLTSSREDLVRLKCGLAPNLDLTLGLTQEKTVTDEGLESHSSPWSDRSYSIGLTFRF